MLTTLEWRMSELLLIRLHSFNDPVAHDSSRPSRWTNSLPVIAEHEDACGIPLVFATRLRPSPLSGEEEGRISVDGRHFWIQGALAVHAVFSQVSPIQRTVSTLSLH